MTIQKTRHFVYLTLLSAMAITLNLIESRYIGSFSFGIRIGLANIIALITINLLSILSLFREGSPSPEGGRAHPVRRPE